MKFGDKVRTMRAVRNMSQSKLGELTGINLITISRIERNKREVDAFEQSHIRIALSWPGTLDIHIEALVNGGFVQ